MRMCFCRFTKVTQPNSTILHIYGEGKEKTSQILQECHILASISILNNVKQSSKGLSYKVDRKTMESDMLQWKINEYKPQAQ